jgi:mannan endo-1,4-beta-mannosidase
MKSALLNVGICGLLLISFVSSAQSNFQSLNYLYSVSGTKTIAGQHGDKYWQPMKDVTGHYAALFGEDFGNQPWEGTSSMLEWRNLVTANTKQHWAEGAVVTLTFHACPPTAPEPCAWSGTGGVNSSLTDAEWTELITDGSVLNNNWKSRLDLIAVHLQALQNSGVEVWLRPLHEMNQGSFWWGGRKGVNGTVKLYQITHDYLTKTKGLTNIVWIWDLQDFGSLSSDVYDYFPGTDYFDIAALDIYWSDGTGITQAKYNAMLNIAGGKPIAIGECDVLPTPDQLLTMPKWGYFMGWAELTQQKNSNTAIQNTYLASNVIVIDKMPGWKSVPANLASNKPVTVSSTEVGQNVAANVTDRSYTTRWSSLYTDTEWMYIDLQDVYNMNEIKITWEAAMGKNYYLETSNDAINWTNQKTIVNNASLVNDYTGLNVNARYVRMYGTARATAFGYSIYEIEVYGKAIPKPYSGAATEIPGIIEAENYDLGGEGIAYHDLSPTNTLGQYRNDAVDIEACADAGAGYNLGNVQATEWTEYSVKVSQTASYNLVLRVAATAAGKTMHIEMDGINISGIVTIPNTGGWQTWASVTIPNITLTAGLKSMKVVFDTDLINLNYVQIIKPIITGLESTRLTNALSVYPNPTTGIVHYALANAGVHQISLYDMLGRLVYNETTTEVKPFSISHLNKGVYQFEILQGNQKLIKKLILE